MAGGPAGVSGGLRELRRFFCRAVSACQSLGFTGLGPAWLPQSARWCHGIPREASPPRNRVGDRAGLRIAWDRAAAAAVAVLQAGAAVAVLLQLQQDAAAAVVVAVLRLQQQYPNANAFVV